MLDEPIEELGDLFQEVVWPIKGWTDKQIRKLGKITTRFIRKMFAWVAPAVMIIVVLALTGVPPMWTAIAVGAMTLFAEMYLFFLYTNKIVYVGAGDWTIRRLLDALKKNKTAGWTVEAKNAVLALRRGFRNAIVVALLPFLAALWSWGADPTGQWWTLVFLFAADFLVVVGFASPPEGSYRKGALLLALVIVLITGGIALWKNSDSWLNQWSESQETQRLQEEAANALPPCAQNPEMRIVPDDDPGITEYEVGPLVAGCVTGIISPPPGTWTEVLISPRDGGSWYNIAYNGGEGGGYRSCRPGGTIFIPRQWPTFTIEGGSGYLTLWVWDQDHPGPPPGHMCS